MDVQWRDTCKSLGERFGHILVSQQWTDVTFQVDSKTFPAHRVFLAAASPVFEAQLFVAGWKESLVISVEDVDPDAFQTLLSYIYTDSADITSVEAAYKVHHAADKFKLHQLKTQCVEYISSRLSPSNVCKAYEFSKCHDIPLLKEKCLELIGEDTEAVLGDVAFLLTDLQTVVEVYRMPCLNISSEVVLLRAAEVYYAAHSEDIPPSGYSHKKYISGWEEVLEQMSRLSVCTEESPTGPSIRRALHQIRFLTLTPQQFSDHVHPSPLLTAQEKCDILVNISTPSPSVAVPQGFSTNKMARSRKSVQVGLEGTKHYYVKCGSLQHKLDVVKRLCDLYRSVIFCRTRTDMDKVQQTVHDKKLIAHIIHEDIDLTQIFTNVQQSYEACHRLIASPTLAQRIDMERVWCCINYEVPPVREYRHTVAGVTVTLVSDDQMDMMRRIEQCYGVHLEEIQSNKTICRAVMWAIGLQSPLNRDGGPDGQLVKITMSNSN